jgi:hypothetical protein
MEIHHRLTFKFCMKRVLYFNYKHEDSAKLQYHIKDI